jgi:hypothetical protein
MSNRLSHWKIFVSVGTLCFVLLAMRLTATPQSTPSATLSTRLQTAAATNDLAGTISLTSATSGTHTFSAAFGHAPVCVVTPTSDPTTSVWVVTTTTSVTAHIHNSSTITFNYVCVGNPN